MTAVRRRAVVHGLVQGVSFRAETRAAALARDVAGWARNLPDGSVEVVLEGAPADVEAVLAFCRRGPRGARVDRVEVAAEAPEGLHGFEVR